MKLFKGIHSVFKSYYFFVFFAFGALFPLLAVYLNVETDLSGTEIGLVMSISPIVMLFVQPIWGMISDKTQKPRQILIVSLICTSLIAVYFSIVEQYLWIIIAATVLAVFQAAIVPISDSITLGVVQRVGGNYGSLRLWGAIGFAFAVFVVGFLSEQFSIYIIFYGFSVALLVAAWFTKRMPEETEVIHVNLFTGLSELSKLPKFMMFLITTFLVFGPIYANNFYFGILIQEIGGTLTGIGIAFLFAAGSEAPFMKFASKAIEKYGMLPILLFSATIAGFRWFIYAFEPTLLIVYLTTIMQGLSIGLFIPAALQYIRDITPTTMRATAVSLYSAIGNGLGTWFCSFVGGMILEYFNVFSLYLFYGGLTMLGVLVLFIIYMQDRKTEVNF